jgi:hypothetical protein
LFEYKKKYEEKMKARKEKALQKVYLSFNVNKNRKNALLLLKLIKN